MKEDTIKINWILECVLGMWLGASIVACSSQGNRPDEVLETQSNHSVMRVVEFDAGVVYADQASYQCVSFDRLGLENEKDLHVINTSCECIDASIVEVPVNQHQRVDAILLNFTPTPDGYSAEKTMERLAVSITLGNDTNQEIELLVNLLHVFERDRIPSEL